MDAGRPRTDVIPLGVGYYTAPEAARLLKVPVRSINRWLGGYALNERDRTVEVPPLWTPHLPRGDKHIELSFRDLIELRFVIAFLNAGVSLRAIRLCLENARTCIDDDRPFATRRFQTDGRTIFLESLRQSGEAELLDLRSRQYVFRQVIERSFKDLDIQDEAVVRWRPLDGKQSIVIDPTRAFGQPIAAKFGVPTVALADAVAAEGSVERVARLFEIAQSAVRDAVRFEASLLAQ